MDQEQTQQVQAQAVEVSAVDPGFDPSVVKQVYRQDEWEEKMKWYQGELAPLQLPVDPLPQDVINQAVRLDKLFAKARLDMAYICIKLERYEQILDNLEKSLFVQIKKAPPAEYSALKFTVDEVKGIVTKVIMDDMNWNNSGTNLYEVVLKTSARKIFISGILDTIKAMKDSLITISGQMKIDASLVTFTNGGQQKDTGAVNNG